MSFYILGVERIIGQNHGRTCVDRYQIRPQEDGTFLVLDTHSGKPIMEPMIGARMDQLSAQALADFRNTLQPTPVRVENRLRRMAAIFGRTRKA